MSFSYISRFNPYTMDDSAILAVATGRKQPLRLIMDDLADMYHGNGGTTHILIHGPRGIGKSFFARYLQIKFEKNDLFKDCRFLLFPEEQSNIQFPSDLARMILSQVEGGRFEEVFTQWEESEEVWQNAIRRLRTYLDERRAEHGKFLLVVLMENLGDVIGRFKGIGESRLRDMLETLPGFVLIGAAPKANLDRDYKKPLFQIFKKYKLQPWGQEEFLDYFTRRRQFEELHRDKKYTPEQVALMEAKLKAISIFTGGFPRMAAVLSNLLLKDDVFSTANTLRGLIDELTPYYQDLTKTLPSNSRKLFDTLIRAGENKSQTELAELLGTGQNKISRAFIWLLDEGYVLGKKREGSKQFRYTVTDRLYCLYYKNREVLHDQNYSSIWLLTDLLVAVYGEDGLRKLSSKFIDERLDKETIELARLTLFVNGIPKEILPKKGEREFWIDLLDEGKKKEIILKLANPSLEKILELEEITDENCIIEKIKPQLNELEKFLVNSKVKREIANALELLAGNFLADSKIKASIYIYNFLLTNVSTPSSPYCASLFNRLGKALRYIGKLKDSLEYHERATKIWEETKFRHSEGFSLRQKGFTLNKLNMPYEALMVHARELKIWEHESNLAGQAYAHRQIGKCLRLIGKYDEAVKQLDNAIDLCEKLKKPHFNYWNFIERGRLHCTTENHFSAIKDFKKALTISVPESKYTWAYSNLGISQRELKKYDEAIISHIEAFNLHKVDKNKLSQTWNIGQAGSNYCLLGQFENAWKIIENSELPKEKIFKQYTDTVAHLEKIEGASSGFHIGNKLFLKLKNWNISIDKKKCLIYYFSNLLEMKISPPLFQDLCEEALRIFPGSGEQTIIRAALATVEYVNGGKKQAYLENLPPDMALVVESIAKEGEL